MIINLNENIELLENIPRDLVAAYKNSRKVNADTFKINPRSQHGELSYTSRNAKNYKYSDATYEPVTAEEAMRRIRRNPEDVSCIRAIIDGQVAEWEARNGSAIYNMYIANLSQDKIDKLAELGYGPVKDASTKFCASQSKLALMLQVADKIYWTDEYQHEFNLDAETGRTLSYVKKDEDGKPILDDEGNQIIERRPETYGDRAKSHLQANSINTYQPNDAVTYEPHNWELNRTGTFIRHEVPDETRILDVDGNPRLRPQSDAEAKPNKQYNVDILDTGDHSDMGAGKYGLRILSDTIRDKKRAFSAYNNARKALEKIKKQAAEAGEEQKDYFDDLVDDVQTDLNQKYKLYIKACDKYTKTKNDYLGVVTDDIVYLNRRATKFIKNYGELRNTLFNISEKLNKLINTPIDRKSDEGISELQHKLDSYKSALEEKASDLEDIKNNCEKAQETVDDIKKVEAEDLLSIQTSLKKIGGGLAEAEKDDLDELSKQIEAWKFKIIAINSLRKLQASYEANEEEYKTINNSISEIEKKLASADSILVNQKFQNIDDALTIYNDTMNALNQFTPATKARKEKGGLGVVKELDSSLSSIIDF